MFGVANFIRGNHSTNVLDVVVRAMDLVIAVPDANYVESTLGANSNSKKGVVRILRNGAEHNTNAVLEEHVGGVLARDAHTVGTATDIGRILPHRRNRVLHKAEETVQKRVVAE